LSYVKTLLPENRFVRIHKSYLVALDSIERLQANAVYVAGKTLPVGNTYKQSLQAVFAKRMPESE
jgi:DNA-binding LytR/AlgR family response regulator